MRRIYRLIACALVAFTSCDKAEQTTRTQVGRPISFAWDVDATRAFGLDTRLLTGNDVSIWLTASGETTKSTYTVQENKVLSSSGGALRYPADAAAAKISALCPAQSAPTPDNNFDFSVQTDQTSETNYAASDLCFASISGLSNDNVPEILRFKHLLSKIEIEVKNATSTITNIQILNVKTKATVNLTDSENPTAAAAADSTSSNISVETAASPTICEAIIVPQTITSGTKFIQVVTHGELITDTDKTYTLALDKDFTFESGESYRFTMNLQN